MAMVTRVLPCPRCGMQWHMVDEPNHVLHLILTLVTGVWLIVWIIIAAQQRTMVCQKCVMDSRAAAMAAYAPPPPPRMPARIPTIEPIARPTALLVSVTVDEHSGFRVTVTNPTGAMVRLLWDESTYVSTQSQSLGRLIRRGNAIAGPQAPGLIAPGSSLAEQALPERGLPLTREYGTARLILTFDGAEGRETWEAALRYG